MRASTLFILAIAILLGVGTVFAVQHFDLLKKKNGHDKKEEFPSVLVAHTNLFQGVNCDPRFVKLRPLTAQEFEKWPTLYRDNIIYPETMAVHNRVMKKNISAGTILLKEHFEDLKMADSIMERLNPDMVAVYVSLPKDQVAGNIIQRGERVDVLYTTTICYDAGCRNREEMTAPIAFNLKVVGKRDNLWNVMSTPESQGTFILEASPYRAALIEHVRRSGILTLMPTNPRNEMMYMDSKDEMTKSIMIKNGTMKIDKSTLMEIFGIKAKVPQPQQQVKQPTPPQYKVIQRVVGIGFAQPFVFPGGPLNGVGGPPLNYNETPPPPSYPSGNPNVPAGPAPTSPTSYMAPASNGTGGGMDDPMEAFITFRAPESCSSLPTSSRKG